MSARFSRLQDVELGEDKESLLDEADEIDENEEESEGEGHVQLLLVGDRDRVLGKIGRFCRKFRRKSPKRSRLINSWIAILISLVVFSLVIIVSLLVARIASEPKATPSTDTHRQGAVAADVPVCSEMAAKILEEGGSAVDAAITALLCVGAVHAESTGIGGGGFMLVHDTNGSAYALNFREAAPQSATVDMYQSNTTLSVTGGLSVAVPGEIRGMEMAHKMFGKLQWKELFQPVIDMCRDGFNLTEHGERAAKAWSSVLSQSEVFRQMYFTADGDLKKAGDLVKRPYLADTLERIADGGAAVFYDGDIAQSIVDTVLSHGGNLTLDDLAAYRAVLEKPIHVDYNGTILYSTPVPSGGPGLLFSLNVLDNYHLGPANSTSGLTYHRIVEVFKYMFAQRSSLGDPDCEACEGDRESILDTQANMTSEEYAADVWRLISDDHTFDPAHYYPHYGNPPKDHGTTHVSVLAPDGQAVSVTSTINTWFGSKLVTKTGIVLNNEMDDFSTPNATNFFGLSPSEVNYIHPGKRPQSSTCPMIAVRMEGGTPQPVLIIGGAGGTLIPTATAQAVLRVMSFKEGLSSAIEARRLHHQLQPNVVYVEEGFPKVVVDYLEGKGHIVTNFTDGFFAVLQGVHVDNNGNVSAHSDSRKQGQATIVTV